MSNFWTRTCTLVSPDLAACRPSQQKHYPPSRRLLFHVLKGMPRLELSIAGLPTTAAAGELLRVQVRWAGQDRDIKSIRQAASEFVSDQHG